jgi:hypothetical protein
MLLIMPVLVSKWNNRRDTENAANEFAVYRNLRSATTCRPIIVIVDNRIRCTNGIVGDVCLIEAIIRSGIKFVFSVVYTYPDTTQQNANLFLSQSLVQFVATLANIQPDIEASILLWEDFNIDIARKKSLLEFTKKTFNLNFVAESSTTLDGTGLDTKFPGNFRPNLCLTCLTSYNIDQC